MNWSPGTARRRARARGAGGGLVAVEVSRCQEIWGVPPVFRGRRGVTPGAPPPRGRRGRSRPEAAGRRAQESDRLRAEDEAFFEAWSPRWEALPDPVREEIVSAVLRDHPYLARPLLRESRVATRLYLEELARREP